MGSTRKHDYSDGQGFDDPYRGFDLDPPEFRLNGRQIDPADNHVLAEFVDESQVVPDDVDVAALVEIGLTYVELGEYEQAIDSFTRAIVYGEEDSEQVQEALVNKGVAHAQLEEYDEAIGAYRDALRINGDNDHAATAETNLAYAMWEDGDSSHPLEHAERAVELDAHVPHAWYNRGYFLLERGLAEEAVRCFENAITLGMRNRWVYEERARAYELLGEHERAEIERAMEDITRIPTDGGHTEQGE
ncbi:tetratricopeptide repeat protein [Haloferax namakaokahaiae]|uniref:Tetratricopeptide repeat protein n=1 Tax=Haloferax namakaokahaiae TaxID=1748331 RepID=A0ABD5ZBZ3_9EURY